MQTMHYTGLDVKTSWITTIVAAVRLRDHRMVGSIPDFDEGHRMEISRYTRFIVLLAVSAGQKSIFDKITEVFV